MSSADPAQRAADLWQALAASFLTVRRGRVTVLSAGGRPAELWPLTQVIHAAALVRAIGVPAPLGALIAAVHRFRARSGWAATRGPLPGRTVYYDDNAWLGLALLQAGRAAQARRADTVTRAGEDPRGGVRWSVRTSRRHACSTAPAVALALRADGTSDAATFARHGLAFIERELTRPDGLVADHVRADGRVSPRAWSYNQGATIGAHRAAWEVLGDESSRERAVALARTSADHFAGLRLWREPPVFAAVLVRNLTALDACLGTRTVEGSIAEYRDRLWDEGRDPRSGLVTSGGVGRYDRGVVIDQAGAVQVFAVAALPPGLRRTVT